MGEFDGDIGDDVGWERGEGVEMVEVSVGRGVGVVGVWGGGEVWEVRGGWVVEEVVGVGGGGVGVMGRMEAVWGEVDGVMSVV
ncbi:hypothetical protein, partial [Brevibacterium casei]|uniref:hypothetical protein n=1 Tax=Brevibacterium casei TaxID=33889 RepID=UPI001C92BADA